LSLLVEFSTASTPKEKAMRRRFNKPNRSQLHLLPISIDQWVEENHLARLSLLQN
jgi:hypothetical protein